MVYEIIRREGEEEMQRPLASLWWSGIAAGLGITASLLAEVFLLQLNGDLGFAEGIFGLILPTFVGNIIGGTGLFAVLAYGQVHEGI